MNISIIGAGVIGLSIARALHLQGFRDLAVIDAGDALPGAASMAAAGMLAPNIENVTPGDFYTDCCRSGDMYSRFAEELSDETGVDIELRRCGAIQLAFDKPAVDHIRSLGRGSILTREEVLRLEPNVSPNVRAGLHLPHEGYVDNRLLMSALTKYADFNGIKRIYGTVATVNAGRDHARITTAGLDVHQADIAIVATGTWSSVIKLQGTAIDLPVRPVRGQMVSWDAAPEIRHLLYTGSGYLVPRSDGRLLAGATVEDVGFDAATTDAAAKGLSAAAAEMVPALTGRSISDQWMGFRPCSPDGLPIIGRLKDAPSVIVATAHYRNGILLAPRTAEIVAGMIIADEKAGPSRYSPERFLKAAAHRGSDK